MQRQHTGLRGGVVHKTSTAEVACHAGNADDMAFLGLQHSREECLDCDPVTKKIDAENLLEKLIGRVKDGMSSSDAGVVDQDGWCADILADGRGRLRDCRRRGDVAFVVANRIV